MVRKRRFNRIRRSRVGKRYRAFRKGKAPLPILPIMGGVVAPMISSANTSGVIQKLQSGQAPDIDNVMGFLDQLSLRYTGYSPFAAKWGNPTWNTVYLMETYGGLLAGIVGHKIANKFGINRVFKRVPMIGKYVQL